MEMEKLKKIKQFYCDECKEQKSFIKVKHMTKLHKHNFYIKKVIDGEYAIYKCLSCGWKWWGLK